MYEELVRKLRNRRICVQSGGDLEKDFPLLKEAADAIEKLQQENDFLKGMQKQIVRGISNKELGQMVYRELRRGGHV